MSVPGKVLRSSRQGEASEKGVGSPLSHRDLPEDDTEQSWLVIG